MTVLLSVFIIHLTRNINVIDMLRKHKYVGLQIAFALKKFSHILLVSHYLLLKRETCCFDMCEQSAVKIIRATDN